MRNLSITFSLREVLLTKFGMLKEKTSSIRKNAASFSENTSVKFFTMDKITTDNLSAATSEKLRFFFFGFSPKEITFVFLESSEL